MTSRLYLMTLNMGTQGAFDLPKTVDKLNALLCKKYQGATCVHKYKVTGETKIVAVFNVANDSGLDGFVTGVAALGNMDITCTPLKAYEKFAQMLGVEERLTKPSTNSISKDKQLHWLEIKINYPGTSTEDFLAMWKREATFALKARNDDGVHIEVFKVLGQRKVHVFIVMEPDDLDKLTFNLPIVQENGNAVTTVCKAIQTLPDAAAPTPVATKKK